MKAILAAALLLIGAAPAPGLRFAVDSKQSEVTAKVGFMGFSSRTARFPRLWGSIELSHRDQDAVALDVTLDAAALTAGDDTMARRLKGESFFHVGRYPTLRFQGSRMERTGAASANVSGLLTVRGVTRPVRLAVTFSQPIARIDPRQPVEIDGTTVINRRDFGMTAYPMVVGRDVTIRIRARMVPAA